LGIENRDYAREDHSGTNSGPGAALFGGSEFPAVRNLIVITVVVYLLQLFISNPNAAQQGLGPGPGASPVQQVLQLDTNKVVQQGQVWRLLTCAFCHDPFSFMHILFNMLLLHWFGRELESIYGSRSFAWFYITAAIVSSLAFLGIQLLTGERIPAIGASGAVMAVMMVYAIYHPRDEIYLFFVIPIQIRFLLVIYVFYDLQPVLMKLAGKNVATGVAHAAHLGGLFYGWVFFRTGIGLQSLWDRFSRSSPATRSRTKGRKLGRAGKPAIIPMKGPYAESRDRGGSEMSPTTNPRSKSEQHLEQQVDQILAKISRTGRDSLTPGELKILERASQEYGQRKDS